MDFCVGIVRDPGDHRSHHTSREAAPNTFAGSERQQPLPRRETLSARGFRPEATPQKLFRSPRAARQNRAGSTQGVTPGRHSSGAESILRIGSAVPVKARLGERAVSTQAPRDRWLSSQKTRARDVWLIQTDAVRSADAERPSGLRRRALANDSPGPGRRLSSRSSLVCHS